MAQARLMYQKALRFRLTFEHPDFLKALQEVKPLERFTHFFECAPLRGGEDLSLYAAVFLRRADVPFLAMHYPGLKNLVRLTVILDGHDEALDDDTWAHCQDSWRIFPGFTGVRQRFGMLLNDLRVKHDLAYYTQILDDIINASRQLIVVKDVRGIYLNVNDAFCNFVGLPRERIIGETDSYVWTQDQANPVLSEYRGHDSDVEVLTSGKSHTFKEKVRVRGAYHQLQTFKAPLIDQAGRAMGTVAVINDQTDYANLFEQVRALTDWVPLPMLILTHEGRVQFANQAYLKLFGLVREDITGIFYRQMRRRILMDNWFFDGWRVVRHDEGGRSQWYKVDRQDIIDVFGQRQGILILFNNITYERSSAQTLRQRANTDALTGLKRRESFMAEVEQRRRDTLSAGIIYVHIGGLAEYNTAHGHHVGDELLSRVGSLILEFSQREQALAARLQGADLIVYLAGLSVEQVKRRARHLWQRLMELPEFKDESGMLTVNVGVVHSNERALMVTDLISHAQQAMNSAKKRGGGVSVHLRRGFTDGWVEEKERAARR